MMLDNAIISISGRNMDVFTGSGVMELVTRGSFYKENDRYVVSYNESELTGMNGTTTIFQIEPKRVTMLRGGQVNTHMVFERDRKHLSLLDTPEGALSVGVCAWKVDAQMDDSGGDMTLEYAVEVDHAVTGANYIHLKVKK
jgi:uncharacterized beta-barrel protein YwiB (DUF1934 family)